MTSLILKIIASLAMLLDHIGYTLAITYPYRIIGRIAFPIYAFMLTEGYYHTKNIKKYILRLGIFALISEIPYNLITVRKLISFGSSLNIFFTLFIALIALCTLDRIKNLNTDKLMKILVSTVVISFYCLLAEELGTDYGFYGILTVICFRYLKNTKRKNINLITGHFLVILTYALSNKLSEWSVIQFCALLSLIPIILYNGKKGFTPANPFLSKTMQIGFYLFYPIHLFILYFINL